MQYGSSRRPRQYNLPNAIIQDDVPNWSSLHDVAANGDDKQLLTLLVGNIDRSVRDSKRGNTPLHEAAWRGFSRCVKILCTPLHTKLNYKNRKLKVKVLETRGAFQSTILGVQNNGGFTALHLAAQNGHNQSCRELLLAGADPDIQNFYGDTALHTACRYGHAGATRILLSASCDPNKSNLNGDSPLHISSAMGRRKLTRILLEVDCDMTLKNAQGETPRDIALRKSFVEIVEILNNPLQLRNRLQKHKIHQKISEEKTFPISSPATGCDNGLSWSPYGCHYFPDTRSFPPPKLETLPKEPLKKGEQYYLDLAGHIRKGPIGIGNTCYCGPFFRHIEDKINLNRKSLRKYVYKAKESLGSKVQALANRTNDQIEQLTRSMIADRVRCENRRLDLDKKLKRGEPIRMTTEYHLKSKRNHNFAGTLTRSRSMDLLEDNFQSNRLTNSNSCGILEETTLIVQHNKCHSDNLENQINAHLSHDQSKNFSDLEVIKKPRWDKMSTDYLNVTERLGNILAKTNEIIELENNAGQSQTQDIKNKNIQNPSSYTYSPKTLECMSNKTFNENKRLRCSLKYNAKVNEDIELNDIVQDVPVLDDQCKILPSSCCKSKGKSEINFNSETFLMHEYVPPKTNGQPNSSGASNLSQHSICCDYNHSSNLHNEIQFKNFSSIKNNDCMLQSVISAFRKDHQKVRAHIESKALNESESTYEDKLRYKEEQSHININGFFQNSVSDESIADIIVDTNMPVKRKAMLGIEHSLDQQINTTLTQKKKNEIKNSEIKSLKKSSDDNFRKKGKVHELVARLQEKLSSTQKLAQRNRESTESESSEDEQNTHRQHRVMKENHILPTGRTLSHVNHSWSQPDDLPILISEKCDVYHRNEASASNLQTTAPASNTAYSNYNSLQPIGMPIPIDYLPHRIIPKDAYFHELPNKNRNNILESTYIQLNHMNRDCNKFIKTNNNNNDIPDDREIMYPSQPLRNTQFESNTEIFHVSQIHSSMHSLQNSQASQKSPQAFNSDYGLYPANFYKPTHQHNANTAQKNVDLTPALKDLLLVERDISNDSGFSIRTFSGSHHPSPILSAHTEDLTSPSILAYSSNGVTATADVNGRPQTGFFSMGNKDSLDAKFNVQSVSSLV